MKHRIGKIIQIAICSDPENGETVLYLDDNGRIWEWKHSTESYGYAEYESSKGTKETVNAHKRFKQLVEVEMSLDPILISHHKPEYVKNNPQYKVLNKEESNESDYSRK